MASPAETRPGTFLAGLSPSARGTLLSFAEPLHFKSGEIIFGGGDPSTRVYVVKSGRVNLTIQIAKKGPVTLMTLGPEELFGWSAMVPPNIQTATARALEESDVLAIDAPALFDACENDPRFGYELYRALSAVMTSRLRATRLQLVDIYAHP